MFLIFWEFLSFAKIFLATHETEMICNAAEDEREQKVFSVGSYNICNLDKIATIRPVNSSEILLHDV